MRGKRKKGRGGEREKSTKEGKGKEAPAIRAGVFVIRPPFSQLIRPFPFLPYPPPFSPFSLSPTPFDACYAGYSKSVMLARLLLREHFQILGSYFLPHTNTVILLDSCCGIIKETGLFSPGFPNHLESVRVNIAFPVVRTEGRSFGQLSVKWLNNSVYGQVITKCFWDGRSTYPWCSTGASESSAIIRVNYLMHWIEWKQVDIAILHKKIRLLIQSWSVLRD